VHIKLRLYPDEDDDLIAFFDGIIPRLRAAMVKQALREGAHGYDRTESTDSLLDILDSFLT
jgi:hypothetical protein